MKIICDSCGAKYSIADEKVEGKVFKIRCKKCSEVIVVEGTDDEVADQQGDYADAYGGTDAAEWYVVIEGERVGPVTAEEVDSYFGVGKLHAESYVWKEGMDDWVMLETVSQFEHLFENATGPNEETIIADQSGDPVSGTDAHMGASADSAAAGGYGAEAGGYDSGMDYAEGGDATAVIDSEKFKQENFEEFGAGGDSHAEVETTGESGQFAAVESGSYDQQESAGGFGAGGDAAADQDDGYESDQGGMFAAFDEADDGGGYDDGGFDDPGFDNVSSGGGAAGGGSADLTGGDDDLVGARNENSVLFSLSNVDNSPSSGSSSGSGGAQSGHAQGSDKSGLIDIQSLASTHAAMKDSGDSGGSGDDEEFVANTMSMPALAPSGSQKSNTGLIIGVSAGAAVLAAVMAVLVVMVVSDDDEPEEETVVAEAAEQQDDEADQDDELDEAAREAQEAAEAAQAAQEDEDEDDEEADEDDDEARAEEEEAQEDDDDDDDEPAVAQRQQPRQQAQPSGGGGGGGGGGTASGGGGSGGGGGGGIADRLDQQQDEPAQQEPEEDIPDSLSRSMVQETIGQYNSRVNDCARNNNPDDLSGNAMVRFVVTGSGNVTSADAQDEFAGTEVGNCIEGVVQSMEFPRTHDDTRTINFPFTVR